MDEGKQGINEMQKAACAYSNKRKIIWTDHINIKTLSNNSQGENANK